MAHGRIDREKHTVTTMIRHHCRKHHGSEGDLCPGCRRLAEYAAQRLDRCPFHEGKTTCARCPVHCYKPAMREQIRAVMAAIGPRMLLTNPLMAFRHALDSLRKSPRK
jgi:predicted amidophosphoribosyltransferase